MEQKINSLLASLDIHTLNRLPCFIDLANHADDFKFRIGLSDGPKISFQHQFQESYNMIIKDDQKNIYQHPIDKGSQQFLKCLEIRDLIYELNADNDYKERKEENLHILLATLKNMVEPIFAV